jgi:lipopolysaccharide transport system permease protein
VTAAASQPATPPAPAVTIIEPPRGWIPLNLRELWQGRELLLFFAWRDVTVRYKQSPARLRLGDSGAAGEHAGLRHDLRPRGRDGLQRHQPRICSTLAALVPWQYFANSITQASNSLVGYSNLLTKIYLPRLFIPMGACIANLVDFVLAFGILLLMMFAMQVVPAGTIVVVPLLMLVAGATALGVGLLLSALNVKYRDVKFVSLFLCRCGCMPRCWCLTRSSAPARGSGPGSMD